MYTYHGSKIKQEWLPIAMANGLDDRSHSPSIRGNLYRFRKAPASWALWWVGWWLGLVWDPKWSLHGPIDQRSRRRASW